MKELRARYVTQALACSAQVSLRVNHWPKGPRLRPGPLSRSGWWTDVWMTNRFRPIASSLSAVGLRVAGHQAQAFEPAVKDSAAT